MRPLPLEAFERFTRVYDCVDASFEEMRKTASERLRRPGTSIRWHFLLANLVVFVSWFFDSGPRTIVALMNILREPGVYIDGIYMFLQIFGFTVWVFSVARISGAVYRYKDRFPIVLLVYSVFILPIFPVLLSFFSFVGIWDEFSISVDGALILDSYFPHILVAHLCFLVYHIWRLSSFCLYDPFIDQSRQGRRSHSRLHPFRATCC